MTSMIASLMYEPGAASFFYTLLRSGRQRKYAVKWLRTLEPEYLLNQGLPWITFDAIDYLDKSLTHGIKVFEYGSGGSTIFWRRFDAECISVEHDPLWFQKVQMRIQQLAGYEVDYRLVLPEQSELSITVSECDAAVPENYLSTDETFAGYRFKNYVSQIDCFPDDSLDVVLIDGRARPSCIRHSVSKVKLGGYLILDNAERHYYTAQTKQLLVNYIRKSFRGVGPMGQWMWQTDIYVRQS